MYHLRKLKSLLLLLFVAVTAQAQLEHGKVYNFVNVGNTGKSMTSATAGNYLSIATTDEADYSQLWYVASDGNGFTLRNLGNGNYLRSPNKGGNTNWTLVKTVDGDNCRFSCTPESEHDVLRAINTTDSYHYMHYGSTTGTVVCWTSSAPATQWDFTEVSGITTEDLTANWEALAAINPSDDVISTYQSALDELFSDKACTELHSAFASMTETNLKEQQAYKNLPATLQQMVLKVCKNSWAEDNYDANKSDWDADYAKKYRVQLYEPYNEPEAAAAALGLNAHTNLNNPTGIFSGGREAMYVMVEGEIKEGASLYLASYTGHGKLGGYRDGVELKQGLNIVPAYSAGNNYCINYVVHTFDTEDGKKKGNKAKTSYKLSQFPDLKIHIEGGYINGYWNKMGDDLYTPDKNADWDYIAARATQTDVTVLGEYITLQFPLGSAVDNDGNTNNGLSHYYTGKNIIESSIQEWDNVMMWERIVLGVLDKTTTEDAAKNPKSPYAVAPNVFAYIGDDTDGFESGYGDYYNVHGLSFGTPHGYMYGGWDHCGYHFNTMGAIMTSMISDAGSHWGPAHEIGHQHQGLLTVNGLTEVTNNLFSNVVLWYYGKTTSRVNGSALEPIAEMFANEEADFFNTTSNVFITTQMYYKLFLYYHVLGHNPKFYPKLFEMLRQDPMSTGYNQRGATSILHFYKKCCEAAGEDLTEFFRAYGFFRVMTNRLVGDYSNSVYNQTQKDIDDAIAEVKALAETKGWEENIAVLFINDDTGGQILSHRSDTEYLKPFESADSELGSYATFNEATIPNYTYTIVGTTMTMEGEGGIGFAIYNENGEIIGFSDNKTFEVSVECAEAIASGKAVVKTMQGDNEAVEAVNIMDTDDTDAKRAMLGELVESAKAVLALSDEDGTKVGFYRASSLEALESAYTQAEQVYEARTVASYSAVYNALFHEYFEVMNDSYARIGLVEGNAYRLTNKAYATLSMAVETSDGENKDEMFALTTTETDAQLWYFEASDTDGRYYLQNKSTKNYPGNVTSGAVLKADKTKDEAYAYELRDMGQGVWALVGNTGLHCSESQSYNIVGWGADSDATQWYITAVDVNENAEALFSLQGLIEKTKDLAGEMANVQYSGKLALQAVSESEPYYLSTNACHNTLNNASDGQGLAGLLDDDTETFFHSDYGGKISNTHYLQVDLGSGNTMSKFAFNYTTRSNGNNCPTEIVVAGSHSNDGTFTTLQTYTATNDNLPNGKALSWESPVIKNTANYRYLRFSVTATENSKIYFVMSTFGITNHETVVKSIEEKYYNEGLTEQTLKSLGEKFFEANELMASDAATSAGLQKMCSSIEKSYYTPLLKIYNDANAARLTALKEELAALIGETTDLIGECGTVNYTPGTFNDKAPLQTTDSEGDFYVWTNAQSTQEVKDYEPLRGYLVNLFDGNNETYFHSDYSGANSSDKLDHHITIKLGENNKTSKFKFKYITRHDAETNYPKTIKIQGSVDGTNFDDIETITGLPTGDTKTYESGYIEANEYYSHLRFMVTANNNNNLKGGHPIFHMAEFELAIEGLPESYTAELKPEAGDAGTDLLIETFKQNAEAQGVYDYASTELQVEAAIAKLQAQYDILKTAKDAVQYVDFTINANVSGGGVTYNEVEHTETLRAPSILTAGDLTAMPVDGYVAKNVTINDATIFVIYNKVYTVKVTGGNGNGGVAYGEGDYMHNDTIQVLGTLDASQLKKIVPDGYELKEEITIDNETGYIHVVFSAIPLVDTDRYYTFECISEYAHSTERFIRDNGMVINGRSAEASLFQFEKADDDNGYHIKSYVTDKYLNHANGAVYASSEKATIWKMEMSAHTPDARTLTVGDNLYLNNNDTDCTDNSCTNLQSKEHPGGVNSDNACSLWTITEGTPLDMTDLKNWIDETYGLIASCYQEGNIDGELLYINSAHVTADLMATTKDAVSVAEERYNSKATVKSEYTAAINALTEAKNNLTTAISNAIAEAEERNAERALLNGLINATKELITLCGTTPGDATQALINEVSAAVTSAQTIADNVENTKDELTEAKEALQAKYDVLYAAQQSTAKADLRALIAQTEALIAQCGTVEYGVHDVPTSIDLQSTDSNADYWISSNADQNTGGGTSDGGGIAALVDNNTGTYFHTRWGGDEVNESHYIQVDMGEDVINKFKFSYIARNNSPAPTIIEIYGWNEDEEPTLITTVTKDWPDYNDNGTYDSELIAPTKAYRYLRFTITKSNGPGNEQYGGQYFFGMKEFDLFSVAEETSYYVESIISYGNITEEQLINVVSVKDTAEVLANNSYDKAALETQIASLQAVYEILYAAHNDYSYLPVTLTTDMESPVLYTLGSKRGDNKVLQYDPADSHMLSIADASAGSAKQLFYFTKGTKHGQVFIHPFAAGEQVLASNDVSDGSAKVKVMPKDSVGYMREWALPVQDASNGVYNIKPITGNTYFSHYGGGDAKLGFYNNTGDPGSRFTFTEATIDGSSAYHSLKVYYDEVTVKDFTNSNPGNYRKSTEIETACNDADELLRVPSGDYATYLKAYRSLRTANESLEIIVPEGGKFYTIKNGDYYITGNTTSGGRIELSTANDANTIYYYDGIHLLSYNTGLYIGLNESDWTFEAVGSNDISTVEFSVSTTTSGAFNIYCGTRWLHRTDAFVNRCSDNIHGTEHSWIIEEVTELPVSVSPKLGFASFYAPVALKMPKGMTAYVVTGVNGDKAPIKALAEEYEVIPANTGVLLHAEGGNYNLPIANSDEAETVEGENLLHGTIDDQYIEYGYKTTHYMLGCKNEVAGLYVVAKNLNSEGGTGGTHFKNNGFKSYLTVSGESGVNALRFFVETTEIDEMEAAGNGQQEAYIYDLQGRRVLNPTNGMYIVNGKKVVIK